MNRHRALGCCLSMISAQTLRVCREGKPLHTFPDHALAGGCDELMNREHSRLVGPALLHLPARCLCQRGKAVKTVFVAVLGVNALAGPEREVMAEHAHALRLAADQVHLDAMAVAVVDRAVDEAGEVEIAAELAIDALQHIEIELGGDAG